MDAHKNGTLDGKKIQQRCKCKVLILPLQDLAGHTTSVDSVAFNVAEDMLAAASSEGIYKLWDLTQGQGKFRMPLS